MAWKEEWRKSYQQGILLLQERKEIVDIIFGNYEKLSEDFPVR